MAAFCPKTYYAITKCHGRFFSLGPYLSKWPRTMDGKNINMYDAQTQPRDETPARMKDDRPQAGTATEAPHSSLALDFGPWPFPCSEPWRKLHYFCIVFASTLRFLHSNEGNTGNEDGEEDENQKETASAQGGARYGMVSGPCGRTAMRIPMPLPARSPATVAAILSQGTRCAARTASSGSAL